MTRPSLLSNKLWLGLAFVFLAWFPRWASSVQPQPYQEQYENQQHDQQQQQVPYKPYKKYSVRLGLDKAIQTVDKRFLSVTLDAGLLRERWGRFDTSSKKLLTLARGLSPAYLRFGGTSADFLVFRENSDVSETLDFANNNFTDNDDLITPKTDAFNMTTFDWKYLNKFVQSVPGWELIFDMNVLQRTNNQWNPNINASALLRLSQKEGFPLGALELGNEPDSFRHLVGHSIDPVVLSEDFARLKELKNSFSLYKKSLLIGPDVTGQCMRKAYKERFFIDFLENIKNTVDAVTVHHYYLNGRKATSDQFIDPVVMDYFGLELHTAFRMLRDYSVNKDLWLGETSSAFGGGAPGLSDSYIAGFLWLDKLGMSAVKGVKVVMRQSFYKGSYALLDFKNFDPRPDYWLSVLYKTLVGDKVLQVDLTDLDHRLRVYAHCSNNHSASTNQSITLYAMNIHKTDVIVTLSQVAPTSELHLYLLEPAGANGLLARSVSLNGKLLQMESDEVLPKFQPRILRNNSVILPARTFAFIVIPSTESAACSKDLSDPKSSTKTKTTTTTTTTTTTATTRPVPLWLKWAKNLLLLTQYWFRLVYFF